MILDNVTEFVVLSEFQKQRFEIAGIPERKISVLPNYAPIPRTDNDKNLYLGDKIVFAGRLSPEKGVLTFLEAAKRLPQYKFVIAGDAGDVRIKPKQILSNVQFLGHVSHSTLMKIYEQARIVIVPSLCFEGFPNVLVEAMGMSKSVICSNIGGLPEIVDDEVTGLLFEPGNAEDLAQRIRYLWDRPDVCRQMGAAGREKALQEYSPEKYYVRLMAIFDKAIEWCSHNKHQSPRLVNTGSTL